jgi:hypothetical protein
MSATIQDDPHRSPPTLQDDAREILKPGRHPPSTYSYSVDEWRAAARLALYEDDTSELALMLDDDATEPGARLDLTEQVTRAKHDLGAARWAQLDREWAP